MASPTSDKNCDNVITLSTVPDKSTVKELFLEILEQPASVFYNAHGGKKEGLTVRIGLFRSNDNGSSTADRTRVVLKDPSTCCLPLVVSLVYSSGLPAASIKSDAELLKVIEATPIGVKGEAEIKFRVQEVSNIHKARGGDGGRFRLHIRADCTQAANADSLFIHDQYTDPFFVKSKNPRKKKALALKRKLQQHKQRRQRRCYQQQTNFGSLNGSQSWKSIRSSSSSFSSLSCSSISASVSEDSDDSIASCNFFNVNDSVLPSSTTHHGHVAGQIMSKTYSSTTMADQHKKPQTSYPKAKANGDATKSGVVAFSIHVLAAMEWVSMGNGVVQCPCCHSPGPNHRQNCALHSALVCSNGNVDIKQVSHVHGNSDGDDGINTDRISAATSNEITVEECDADVDDDSIFSSEVEDDHDGNDDTLSSFEMHRLGLPLAESTGQSFASTTDCNHTANNVSKITAIPSGNDRNLDFWIAHGPLEMNTCDQISASLPPLCSTHGISNNAKVSTSQQQKSHNLDMHITNMDIDTIGKELEHGSIFDDADADSVFLPSSSHFDFSQHAQQRRRIF